MLRAYVVLQRSPGVPDLARGALPKVCCPLAQPARSPMLTRRLGRAHGPSKATVGRLPVRRHAAAGRRRAAPPPAPARTGPATAFYSSRCFSAWQVWKSAPQVRGVRWGLPCCSQRTRLCHVVVEAVAACRSAPLQRMLASH